MTTTIGAHKMVSDLCQGLANDLFDQNSSDNDFHRKYPDRRAWVSIMAPVLIDDARDLLASIAQLPDTEIGDVVRINQALTLDEQIPEAASRVQVALKRALEIEMLASAVMQTSH